MSLLNRLIGFYTMVADATKEFFIRILMGVLIFLGYVLLSLFIYAVMRRIMVPQKLHVIPVHLQYRSAFNINHYSTYLELLIKTVYCILFSPGCRSGGGSFPCSFPQAGFQLNGGKKVDSLHMYGTMVYFMAVTLLASMWSCTNG